MRKHIVAGNWKMNNSIQEGLELVKAIKANYAGDNQLIIGAPFLHLSMVNETLEGSSIAVAAQNCHHEESGAFTGEISTSMLASANIPYVIIGHSERREYNHETNAQLAAKVDLALKDKLIPIFCCGESLEIREKEQHFNWITAQLKESVFHLTAENFAKIVIAYEPIWAIGTGVTASVEQAQEIHAHIRKEIARQYDTAIADGISILYGGSCKPDNAQELFANADVDGGLIGGASLKADEFIAIANSF